MVNRASGQVLSSSLHAVDVENHAFFQKQGHLKVCHLRRHLDLRAEVHGGESRGDLAPPPTVPRRPRRIVEPREKPRRRRREGVHKEEKGGGVVDQKRIMKNVGLTAFRCVENETPPGMTCFVGDNEIAAAGPALIGADHLDGVVVVWDAKHVTIGSDLIVVLVHGDSPAVNEELLAQQSALALEKDERRVLRTVIDVHCEQQLCLADRISDTELVREDAGRGEGAGEVESVLVERHGRRESGLNHHAVVRVGHSEPHGDGGVGLCVYDGGLCGDDRRQGAVKRDGDFGLLSGEEIQVGDDEVVFANQVEVAVTAGLLAEEVERVDRRRDAQHQLVHRLLHLFAHNHLAFIVSHLHLHQRSVIHLAVHHVPVVTAHHADREVACRRSTVVTARHPHHGRNELLRDVAHNALLLRHERQSVGEGVGDRPHEHGHVGCHRHIHQPIQRHGDGSHRLSVFVEEYDGGGRSHLLHTEGEHGCELCVALVCGHRVVSQWRRLQRRALKNPVDELQA